jgi:hypothetical protein
MKTKLVYVLVILVMVLSIGVGVWVMLAPRQLEPIKKYVATSLKDDNLTEITETTETSASAKEFTPEERALEAKETFLAQMEFVGVDTENDPYWRALYAAVNSAEYLEYQKKQNARVGTDLDLWWSFLESKGLSSGRMAQEERFREHFPTGEYAKYEPDMRKRLAELFLETDLLPTTTNDEENVRQTIGVLSQFRSEAEANSVWMRGYFNGYVGDLEWAQEVRENAASIVTDADSVDAVPVFTESAPVAEPTPAKVAEENLGSEPEPLLFSEETPTSEGLKQVPSTVEEIEAELLKTLFPDERELPTESSIENVVREQFSPQRFNAAVRTLSQYGPQEGLRRLKASDPEIAIYVERLIQRNKETGK